MTRPWTKEEESWIPWASLEIDFGKSIYATIRAYQKKELRGRTLESIRRKLRRYRKSLRKGRPVPEDA